MGLERYSFIIIEGYRINLDLVTMYFGVSSTNKTFSIQFYFSDNSHTSVFFSSEKELNNRIKLLDQFVKARRIE